MVRKGTWILMTLLATMVAAYAFASIALPSLRSPFVTDLVSEKALRTFGHLAAGGLAIVTGALQFSAELRFRRPRAHRLLGRVYLIAVLVSGIAGGLLAPSSSGGLPGHFGFGLLAALWLTTSGAAWLRARAGDFSAHRAWMIRSYALCLAAVTLRLYLPLSAMAGLPFESAYPVIAWFCWVPNLIIAEWVIVPGSLAPLEQSG